MLVSFFQRVQEKYEREGWNFHHEQELEFEEYSTDSSPAVTLHFDEKSSSDDMWKVVPLGPPKVRCFSLQVHYYVPNVQYTLIPIRLRSIKWMTWVRGRVPPDAD